MEIYTYSINIFSSTILQEPAGEKLHVSSGGDLDSRPAAAAAGGPGQQAWRPHAHPPQPQPQHVPVPRGWTGHGGGAEDSEPPARGAVHCGAGQRQLKDDLFDIL